MQISVSARHGQLSQLTQEKIQEKVQKLTRIFDRLTAVLVTVNLEHRETPHVEIKVSAEHTDDFVASERDELMVALDRVIHKLEQQIRKHKEKITGHRAKGLKRLQAAESDNEGE